MTRDANPPGAPLPERWRALVAQAGPAAESEPPERDVEYWRGLEAELGRRRFLQLAGAGMALAGLGGCRISEPDDVIVPFREQPPETTPGNPTLYATSVVLDGYAVGVVVASHVGRPTKIEGNPEHPASLGATGVFEQASVLDLYDPARLQRVTRRRLVSGWSELAALARAPDALARTHLLLEPTSSPLVASLLDRLRARVPSLGVSFHAPLAPLESWAASRLAFGRVLETQYDLARADVVLALDADLLERAPGHLRHARAFGERRAPDHPRGMNRLYVVEPGITPTGLGADHRLAVPGSAIPQVTAAVFAEVARAAGASVPPAVDRLARGAPGGAFARVLARDLARARGRSLVVVGERQPAAVQALGHALNELLGNAGATVSYTRPVLVEAGEPSHDLQGLAARLDAGEIDRLVVLEGNPAYTAPADLELAKAMQRVSEVVYLGLHENETSRLAAWVLPASHYLESWGDARAFDGTLSLVQPLVRPLYDTRSVPEVLGVLAGIVAPEGRALLRQRWTGSEAQWADTLRRGFVPGTSSAREQASVRQDAVVAALAELSPPRAGTEVALAPDPRVHDGRFAHNPWLLELPAPLTTLTWLNAAHLAPETASALGVSDGDVLRLESDARAIELPALVTRGHAAASMTVTLGWGQATAAKGANAYLLRTRAQPYFVRGVRVTKTGRREELPRTQGHLATLGRPIALAATLAQLEHGHNPAHAVHQPEVSFHDREPRGEAQWGMSIDMSKCIACGACAIACQAENNVPVVGRAGVLKSREMHWLRIDYYHEERARPGNELAVVAQPMLCQHCEKAPCEYVCPTHATVHSSDGLNEMVYNRCIGTRFCSNNCPYKVRRFNWFDYHRERPETEKMQMNPDVTVRARGVMEKCTYCVQRIRRAGISARVENRQLGPAEVQTACQQACPTQAIVFGDIARPEAEVARLRRDPRAYGALEEIGTAPRTRYLVKVRNENPELS